MGVFGYTVRKKEYLSTARFLIFRGINHVGIKGGTGLDPYEGTVLLLEDLDKINYPGYTKVTNDTWKAQMLH